MPAIMLFQKSGALLSLAEISQSLSELLGLNCSIMIDGDRISHDEYENASAELHSGTVYIELPDLEEDEGEPTVSFEALPRLDRDDSMQKLIDEIVDQEISLKSDLNDNSRDLVLSFDDTPAGMEAGYALAYTIASETGSGILFPGFTDDDDTVWFDNAEDFADAVFGEGDDDDDDEEDEEDDEDEDVYIEDDEEKD